MGKITFEKDESSDDSAEKRLKADKKSKKKDKKDKKDKKSKKKSDRKRSEPEDSDCSAASGEFVASKRQKNTDFKELLFGGHKVDANAEDSKTNYLNGRAYSAKYFDLLKTRKSLPAWACK